MATITNLLADTWIILLTILGFSFIIFVHELGHFLMAKRAGVKVDKFYIGFDFGGLKIFSIIRGETEYGIGIFPFGGYVKLHGYEELPGHEIEIKDLPVAHFHAKTVGERFGIMVGGVAMNFISAVFLILIMYGVGKEFAAPIVGRIQSVAALQGGLKENDKIISIDGTPIKTFLDIRKKIVLSKPSENLIIKIERNKEIKELVIQPRMNYEQGVPELGVSPQLGLKIGAIYDGSPASKAGLLPDDKIATVNGEKIEKYYQFEDIVEKNPLKELKIEVLRKDKPIEFTMMTSQQPSFMMRFNTGLKNNSPIEIESVSTGTAAEKAGLQAWDKIDKINDQIVSRVEDISAIIAETNGNEVQVELLGKDSTIKLAITPIYNPSDKKFMLGIITSQGGDLGLIEDIEVNGPIYLAGLRIKDKITAINDKSTNSLRQLEILVMQNFGNTVNISYERMENGEWKQFQSKILLRTPTRIGFLTKLYHKSQTLFSGNKFILDPYGLGSSFNKDFILANPVAESPAAKAGFQAGDRFVAVSFVVPGEEKINSFNTQNLPAGWNSIDLLFSNIASRMSVKKGKVIDTEIIPEKLVLNIKYERDGKQMETLITPVNMVNNKKGFSGIFFSEETILYRYSSVGEAANLVYAETFSMLDFTISSFSRLITGSFGSDALSGPFGIIPLMHQVAKSGIIELIWLIAMLSVNIGFMNFLPFPPLDGGAIFFLLIEKLKGSPVRAKVPMGRVLCLIALMLFVTMNDISKYVG